MLTRKALVIAALSLTFFAAPAQAQATRTWVSGVGDDANPCSRTAPCKTFAGAISKTAAGGLINVLDPGAFGSVTITKAITIDGGHAFSGVLASSTNGVNVNAGSADVVVLRNLNLSGAPPASPGQIGIRFLNGRALHIERCEIDSFSNRSISFEPNSDAQLYVRDTVIRNPLASGGGVELKPAAGINADAVFDNVQILRGVFGIRVLDRAAAVLRGCTIAGQVNNGVLAFSSTADVAEVDLESCVVTQNGLAGVKSEGANATIRLAATMVNMNGTGLLSATSGKILSYGNNRVAGNATDGAPTGTIILK